MSYEFDPASVRVIILAGGRGSRLAPYTTVLPKPLMPIGDMPILEVVLRQLGSQGFRRITLCVGYLASLLEAYCGDGRKWDVSIDYSREHIPLGTAGPIALVEGLDRTFLVMNGDLLTTLDYVDMVRFHQERQAVATVGLFHKPVNIDLGVIETDGLDRVTTYVEKPTLTYDVSMGVYVFDPRILEYIPKGQYLNLPDLIRQLISRGEPVVGYRFDGEWLDIGRREDYSEAIDLFATKRSVFLPDQSMGQDAW